MVLVVEPIGGPVEFAADRNVWERQGDESDRQWSWFRIYRDMDTERRTLVETWREYARAIGRDDQTRATLAPQYVAETARNYRWRERARAYDMYMDERAVEALEATRVRARVEAAGLGRMLRIKAAQAARLLQTITTQKVVVDGKQRTVARSALTPGQIVKLAKAGAELERVALGMEDGRGTSVQVNVQANILHLDDDAIVRKAERVLEARQVLLELEAKGVRPAED